MIRLKMKHKSNFGRGGLTMLLLLLFAFGWQAASAQVPRADSPIPKPENGGRVGDYANVLDAATKTRIENKLKRLRDVANLEFGVAIVPTTNGAEPFDYSLKIARGWGVGAKEDRSSGLLLFAAINDRKYFTQISRELEGDLTDAESKMIAVNTLVPAFRAGNYGKGIEDTLDSFIKNIAQKRNFDAGSIIGYTAPQTPQTPRYDPPVRQRQPQAQSLSSCCTILIVVVIILFIIFSSRGGRGGGGGLLQGLILGSILSNATSGSGWSGGSFGGSSSGGGGSDWGGFGGGGDFGGGGSGGDW